MIRGNIIEVSSTGVMVEVDHGRRVAVLGVGVDDVTSLDDGLLEVRLASDARMVVWSPDSAHDGVVASDVFAVRRDDAGGYCACNCNCNCSSGGGNCNCNCNCSRPRIVVPERPSKFRVRL